MAQPTHRYDFRWYAPAQPKAGMVLAGEIIHEGTRLGGVWLMRTSVLKPQWHLTVEVRGHDYPGPRLPRYREALRVAHAILRNGIEPGYHDREMGD